MNPPYPIISPDGVLIAENATLIHAITALNESPAKMVLIKGDNNRVIGSLTDGDVRRALLKGCSLESPVAEAMHRNPYVMAASSSKQQIIDAMLSAHVKQMPLLAPDGSLIGIAVYDMLTGFLRPPRSNPVVIMAGGMGKRLLPLTQDIPKPMVRVGGKPILEHIIERFVAQGFSDFYISLYYLGHAIEDYFGDGEKWHCRIRYLREKESLGTAGALSLFEATPADPFIVINGDILSSVDGCDLLEYHVTSESAGTVCARQHRMEVPYGVIRLQNGMMEAIVEKPVYDDLVSAGIYALSPECLAYVKPGEHIDMPALLQAMLQDKKKVAVFPLRESWIDVGQHDDLENAKHLIAEG